MEETRTLQVGDGRTLAFCEWGVPEGRPLFYLHGTPGGRLLRHVNGEYERHQLRVITYDRPGYGRSTRLPGRPVEHVVGDVAAIADHLELGSFGVLGVSGGGRYALAVAALLPQRVSCCATVVSGAPFGAEGLDWLADVPEATKAYFDDVTVRGHEAVLEAYTRVLDQLDELNLDDSLPPAERNLLVEVFRDGLAAGPGGFVDDRLAEIAPWRIELGVITAPTRIMLARDDDVPASHGYWLLREIPLADVLWVAGGHWDPRREEEEDLLRWMSIHI